MDSSSFRIGNWDSCRSMESGEDANSDDNNEVDQEPMNVRAQEGTSGRNSPGSTSTSVSTDTSVNDPTPSVSNTSVLRPTGTVNANNWKSANAFMNYVQDFRQVSLDLKCSMAK